LHLVNGPISVSDFARWYYLRGVAPPEVHTTDIYKGIIPFVAIQVLALVLLWYFPAIATWLPTAIYGP
jgi:TRAP-type mannitol/chloroaromatic compound transport system permease large subunit